MMSRKILIHRRSLIVGAAGIAMFLLVLFGQYAGHEAGQADIELLKQVWPYLPQMSTSERAFLAGLSLTCQLHRNAEDRESTIACLRRAAADPDATLPKDFEHAEAPARLERMLSMSPVHP